MTISWVNSNYSGKRNFMCQIPNYVVHSLSCVWLVTLCDPVNCRPQNLPARQETQEMQVQPWVRKNPWSRKWKPTPVFLPGKSHRQRNLMATVHAVAVGHDWVSMSCSTPGFPVLLHLLELAQTHVHRVSDAIQPSHPLPPVSPFAFHLSHHQGLSQWSGSSQSMRS